MLTFSLLLHQTPGKSTLSVIVITLNYEFSDFYNICYPTRSGAFLRQFVANQADIDQIADRMVNIDYEGFVYIQWR